MSDMFDITSAQLASENIEGATIQEKLQCLEEEFPFLVIRVCISSSGAEVEIRKRRGSGYEKSAVGKQSIFSNALKEAFSAARQNGWVKH